MNAICAAAHKTPSRPREGRCGSRPSRNMGEDRWRFGKRATDAPGRSRRGKGRRHARKMEDVATRREPSSSTISRLTLAGSPWSRSSLFSLRASIISQTSRDVVVKRVARPFWQAARPRLRAMCVPTATLGPPLFFAASRAGRRFPFPPSRSRLAAKLAPGALLPDSLVLVGVCARRSVLFDLVLSLA